jgi:hypothetical protein
VRGSDNISADILSRAPLRVDLDDVEIDVSDCLYLNFILDDIEVVTDVDIVSEIQRDLVLSKVYNCILTGQWPSGGLNPDELELKPYLTKKNELSVSQGFILWGHRLVIPPGCRKMLLQELHSTHLGVVKMKSVARSYIWWPGIDRQIEMISKSCPSCLQNRDNPARVEVNPWPQPKQPGMRVHVDFLGPYKNLV